MLKCCRSASAVSPVDPDHPRPRPRHADEWTAWRLLGPPAPAPSLGSVQGRPATPLPNPRLARQLHIHLCAATRSLHRRPACAARLLGWPERLRLSLPAPEALSPRGAEARRLSTALFLAERAATKKGCLSPPRVPADQNDQITKGKVSESRRLLVNST